MLLLYYIILPISEPSISFFVLYDHVICDCDRYYAYITCDITSHPLSMLKIKKSKKNKVKRPKNKIKGKQNQN